MNKAQKLLNVLDEELIKGKWYIISIKDLNKEEKAKILEGPMSRQEAEEEVENYDDKNKLAYVEWTDDGWHA